MAMVGLGLAALTEAAGLLKAEGLGLGGGAGPMAGACLASAAALTA